MQGLKADLISPQFLNRVEIDPDPTSIQRHTLSSFKIASRSSYFFWSSMSDAEFFELALS